MNIVVVKVYERMEVMEDLCTMNSAIDSYKLCNIALEIEW